MSMPTPNYINPPTRGPTVLGVNIAMICMSFCFVSLRIFTRLKLTSMGVDDLLICIAWLLCFAMTFCVVLSVKYGLGRHFWDIPPEWSPMGQLLAYIFTAFYDPILLMTKSSIIAFYINKLGTEKNFRWACRIAMGYVISSSTAIFFAIIFQCVPIAGGWNRSIPGRKCINTHILYSFSGVNNLVTDLVLFFLPVPTIVKLNLPWKQKAGLVVVFSMGLIVTCISIYRLHLVAIANHSKDLPWAGALSSTLSAVELNTAIACACMPAFKQFLSWVAPGVMGSTLKKSKYYSPNSSGGVKYSGSTGPRRSIHELRSVGRSGSGPNTTVTAVCNDSEEYIMNELDTSPGTTSSPPGINKTMEISVKSEVVSIGDDKMPVGKGGLRRGW